MRSHVPARLPVVAVLCLAAAAVALAQDAARGAILLGLAQQAIGGANRLNSVKTLQVTGTFRRVVGTNDTEGDFEVFIELPASQGTAPSGSGVSYLRSEKTGTPGQPSTETREGLVAGQPLDAVRGGGRGAGGGGPIGGDGPPADAGAEAPQPEAVAEAAAPAAAPVGGRGRGGADPDALLRQRQADVSRLLLMWLLRSETPLAWVGIAESPDGRADVLEVRYADGQPTRLFLEAASHMPLMLQWQAVPAQGRGGRGARGGGRGGGRGQAQPGIVPPDGATPAAPVTMDMTFSEHREVNGIRLPHVITRGTNGTTTERWTVSRYRVNPSFNAETFTR